MATAVANRWQQSSTATAHPVVNGGLLILLELLLVFGLAMGFGLRELRSLKRLREAREQEARKRSASSDSQ